MQLLHRGLRRDQPTGATCMIKYTDRLGRKRCKGGPDLRPSQHYPDSFGREARNPAPNLHCRLGAHLAAQGTINGAWPRGNLLQVARGFTGNMMHVPDSQGSLDDVVQDFADPWHDARPFHSGLPLAKAFACARLDRSSMLLLNVWLPPAKALANSRLDPSSTWLLNVCLPPAKALASARLGPSSVCMLNVGLPPAKAFASARLGPSSMSLFKVGLPPVKALASAGL